MPPTFAELTTMRLGGPIAELVDAPTNDDVVDAVRQADAAGTAAMVMGGGSNLVVGDEGWGGRVVRVASESVEICGPVVRADAGLDWDRLVVATLEAGLSGFEPLSGIPGRVGATPVQNVGAFGALTSQVLESVTVLDRASGQLDEWANDRCGFGSHRQSVFKHTDRYVILAVTYRLRKARQSRPITFERLAERLGIELGGTASPADVRSAVLELRRERGSVLDADDHDTWSVGSFFLNPVLESVPPQAAGSPTYPDPAGTKLPAGWLIDKAGFPPGYGTEWGRGTVALSSKHALAITNRGGASTAEVMRFAAHVRAGVRDRFDVWLSPECHLVNCRLDDR